MLQNPLEKIRFYINHRLQREQQIIAVLSNHSSSAFCEEELVKIIYKDLPDKLVKAAASNVNHHLVKLLKENRVKKEKDKWQLKKV